MLVYQRVIFKGQTSWFQEGLGCDFITAQDNEIAQMGPAPAKNGEFWPGKKWDPYGSHGHPTFNGHDEKEPIKIGGTDSIYFWPIFQAYVRAYPHKIWPYMVQYLYFRILECPLIHVHLWEIQLKNHQQLMVFLSKGKACKGGWRAC